MNKKNAHQAGLSLVETMGILAIIGIISGVGMFVAQHTTKGSEAAKLANHVSSLNSAVDLYIISGGSLPSIATGDATLEEMIVSKLKSQAKRSEMHSYVGFTGSTVDPRLVALMEAPKVGEKRAVWNIGKKRFDLVEGIYGVKEFAFGDEETIIDEDRDQFVKYSSTANWVWDYSDDFSVTPQTAPETIETSGTFDTGLADTGSHTPDQLDMPSFSLEGGAHDIEVYNPGVQIANPNASGRSVIYYSIDNGTNWYHHYAETKQIYLSDYPASIKAYSLSIDPDNWLDSETNEVGYQAIRDPLLTVTGTVSTTAP